MRNLHGTGLLSRNKRRFGRRNTAREYYLDQYEDAQRRALYRERFRELFNYAVVPFYWDTLEPIAGEPRFLEDAPFVSRRPPIDTIMRFCNENGIRAKGHCLVYNAFQPRWISEDNETLKRQIAKRIAEIAKRYGDIILMHDLYQNTYEATVIILARLYEMGYEVVTVSELLGDDLQPGRTYVERD